MARIQSSGIAAEAVARGAELSSIVAGDGTEYLWQGDPAFWARRSPILFPIVGGLQDGEYEHAGKVYRLANHGFAKEFDFNLIEEREDRLRYRLTSDERTTAQYPFAFALELGYRVERSTLAVEYRVRNEGDEPMPFSIGAHPAFRAPLFADERREEYELVFERTETVDRHFLGSTNTRTGETERFLSGEVAVSVTPSLFERGAIVLTDHVSRSVTLRNVKTGRGVKVAFSGFPQLGIWSPKGDCPFVCIEPWYGVMPLAGSTKTLTHKEAVLTLAPGEEFSSEYTIELL